MRTHRNTLVARYFLSVCNRQSSRRKASRTYIQIYFVTGRQKWRNAKNTQNVQHFPLRLIPKTREGRMKKVGKESIGRTGKKKKGKIHPVQALRLCTGRKVHRGSRGIVLPFHDHGITRGWGVNVTPWPLFTPAKGPVPIVQEGGWAPGPVWTGAENFAPTGIRSPDRPDLSQSLYRLSYPAHIGRTASWGKSYS